MTQRQVLEEVLPLRGIEEVGHDGGVLGEGAHVEPEPVHQLLRAVRDERRAAGRDELADRRDDVVVVQQLRTDEGDVTVGVGRARVPTTALCAGSRAPLGLHREAVTRLRDRAQPVGGRRGIALDLDIDVERLGFGHGRGRTDRFHHPRQQRAELELIEEDADALRVERALLEIRELGTAVDVETEDRHLAVQAHAVGVLGEVRALLRGSSSRWARISSTSP